MNQSELRQIAAVFRDLTPRSIAGRGDFDRVTSKGERGSLVETSGLRNLFRGRLVSTRRIRYR